MHLFKEFLAFWENTSPDIITGWNTEFFDIPYLCNRIRNVFDEEEVKRLSPWKNVFARDVYQMGRTHQSILWMVLLHWITLICIVSSHIPIRSPIVWTTLRLWN